jgi:hypothetical protein
VDRIEEIRERLSNATPESRRDLEWALAKIEKLQARAELIESAAWDAVDTECKCSEVESELAALWTALETP